MLPFYNICGPHILIFLTRSILQTKNPKNDNNVQLPKLYLPLFKYVEQTTHSLEDRLMPEFHPGCPQRLGELGNSVIRLQIHQITFSALGKVPSKHFLNLQLYSIIPVCPLSLSSLHSPYPVLSKVSLRITFIFARSFSNIFSVNFSQIFFAITHICVFSYLR